MSSQSIPYLSTSGKIKSTAPVCSGIKRSTFSLPSGFLGLPGANSGWKWNVGGRCPRFVPIHRRQFYRPQGRRLQRTVGQDEALLKTSVVLADDGDAVLDHIAAASAPLTMVASRYVL